MIGLLAGCGTPSAPVSAGTSTPISTTARSRCSPTPPPGSSPRASRRAAAALGAPIRGAFPVLRHRRRAHRGWPAPRNSSSGRWWGRWACRSSPTDERYASFAGRGRRRDDCWAGFEARFSGADHGRVGGAGFAGWSPWRRCDPGAGARSRTSCVVGGCSRSTRTRYSGASARSACPARRRLPDASIDRGLDGRRRDEILRTWAMTRSRRRRTCGPGAHSAATGDAPGAIRPRSELGD